jgi:hypothetical protein
MRLEMDKKQNEGELRQNLSIAAVFLERSSCGWQPVGRWFFVGEHAKMPQRGNKLEGGYFSTTRPG